MIPNRNPRKPPSSFLQFTKLPENFNTGMLTDEQYEKALMIGVIALINIGELELKAETGA